MGRAPYQKVEARVRGFVRRPEVQRKVSDVKSTAVQRAQGVVSAAKQKLPRRQSSGAIDPTGSYADPQDLQFGAAASAKEERLDALLGEGIPAEQVAEAEDQLRGEGEVEPRPGNKAEPVSET